MGSLLFISGQEIFLIVLVVLVLFGANKMPELAKGLGKGMREFRKAADDIKREIENSTTEIKKDLNDITDDIKKDINV
jgi:sec-independent protein translocase protein TatA